MELQEKDIRRIAKEEARRVLREAEEKKRTQKERDTMEIMERYRDAAFHLQGIRIGKEGAEGKYIDKLERTGTETRILIRNVNRVLTEMEQRRRNEGRQQEYKAFAMHYLDGLSYEQAAQELEKETGERISQTKVWRWCDAMVKDMAVLLWGI